MRALCVLSLVSVLVPGVASAQSYPAVSIRAAAGPTIVDSGHSLSAAVGWSPTTRVTFLLDVQRTQLSSRFTRDEYGYFSGFRGGTLTAVSGELRVGLWPAHRVTPYGLIGLGSGRSRPNVNEAFPNPVTHAANFMFYGLGVHVPVRERLSLFGDARLMFGSEGREGMLVMFPVRVGMAWRF